MKTFISMTLLLVSVSSFAGTRYECSSKKGDITVTLGEKENIVDFSKHSITQVDYFSSAYYDLVQYPNWANNTLTISEDLLEREINSDLKIRLLGFRYKNNSEVFIANSPGSQDFSSYKTKFKLNKKQLTAKVSYVVSAWLQPYGRMNDSLKCIKK